MILTKDVVGHPEKPNFDYKHDDWYDIDKGFDPTINYSKLRVTPPELSAKLWKEVDKDLLHDLRYFAHNVQKGWEVKYGVIDESEYEVPEDALDLDVEYFGFWATADDRLRYICENIVTNDSISLIDKIGNGLASHFYGARNVHLSMTGKTDPKEALISYSQLAEDQAGFTESGVIGEYTANLRTFLESQKKAGVKFWGTTELHTSIQTAGRRLVNELYLGDRMNDSKGTTANVAEWIASWKNSGLMDKMLADTGLKAMCEILGSEWGIGDYYKFHGGSDLSLCPELNAYLDERYVIPGPGASETLKNLFPNLAKKDVSYEKRVIWIRENQKELLGLPMINEFFHELKVGDINIFPEKIDEIKTTQAEVLCCQFGIFKDLQNNPHKIPKRKVARQATSCSLEEFFEK